MLIPAQFPKGQAMDVSHGTLEWTLLAVAAAVPLFVGLATLMTMPRHLRDASRKNAYRYDGTFCPERAFVEWKAKVQLVGGLIGLQLLIVLPVVLLVCVFHQSVMPLDTGWNALSSLVQDPEGAREVIRDLRDEQIGQGRLLGESEETIRARQGMVWNAWPMLVVIGLVVALGAVAVMQRIVVQVIRQYRLDLLERQRAYLAQDVAEVRERERRTFAEGITVVADSSEPCSA